MEIYDSIGGGQCEGDGNSPRSGEKYVTRHGFSAIKDGIKPSKVSQRRFVTGKPQWMRAHGLFGERYSEVKAIVERKGLVTVCKEAKCPNISECWNSGTATFMLLGEVCTRACRFCAVNTGNPNGWIDPLEPGKVAASVEELSLDYVVLTSVNRDDLADGGAGHFAETIRLIKKIREDISVEALTPDFQGKMECVAAVIEPGADVFAQNIETIARLTHPVRDRRAGYEQTLSVLARAKDWFPSVLTKSSMILGLGETDAEILQTMQDLRKAKVDILTLGQYLQPTRHHLPVQRWVNPEQFKAYEQTAFALGFLDCVAGPMVRSSYRAERTIALKAKRETQLP